MEVRDGAAAQALSFFEELWKRGDPWALGTAQFEHARYRDLRSTICDRHYASVLEIGCGNGAMTRELAAFSDRVLALDISPTAIEQARDACADLPQVEFRQANIMQHHLGDDGSFDLVVMSETIYYLGWLYPMFDVGWLVTEIHRVIHPGGRLLLANTLGEIGDALVLPWIIHTYRDLCRNVGFRTEHEHLFRGTKDGVDLKGVPSIGWGDRLGV